MNLRQATVSGVVAYVIIFIIGSILIFGINIPTEPFGLVILSIMPLVIFLVARYLYFNKIKAKAMEGLFVGVYWLLLSLILDIAILVYGFNIGWDYFLKANWTMPVGYAEYVVFAFVAGYLSKR